MDLSCRSYGAALDATVIDLLIPAPRVHGPRPPRDEEDRRRVSPRKIQAAAFDSPVHRCRFRHAHGAWREVRGNLERASAVAPGGGVGIGVHRWRGRSGTRVTAFTLDPASGRLRWLHTEHRVGPDAGQFAVRGRSLATCVVVPDTTGRGPSGGGGRPGIVGTGLILRNGKLRSLDELYRFDPAQGSFQTLPSAPERVDHAAFVGYRGALYLIGGYVDDKPTAAVWRFSPRTRLWSALPADAHQARRSGSRGHRREDLCGRGLFPGVGNPQSISDLEIYDVGTGTWSRGPSMPTARHHHGAAAIGGRLVVVGGRGDDDLSLNTVEQFDPSTNRWTRLAPLPVGVGGLAVVAAAGQIVAIGGGDDDEQWVTPATWAFDPHENTWRRLADLNVARHGHGAVGVGPDVYVFGGAPCPGYGRTNAVESLRVTAGPASR